MPKSAILIRWAEAKDAPVIHQLLLALADTLGERSKIQCRAEDIARFGFGDAPIFKALIADSKGQAVGLCLLFLEFSTWRGRPGVYVQDLYIDPRLRRSGLGKKLLSKAAEYGRKQGCMYLRLSVASRNKSGRRFYQRLGFLWQRQERIYQISDQAFEQLADDGQAF